MRREFFLFLFLVVLSANVFALSDEAYNASISLSVAKSDINEVLDKGLNVSRMNESYNEALQLYEAQVNLEKMGRKANFKLVFDFVNSIRSIKENELAAKDELEVFLSEYNSVSKSLNLSEMDEIYNNIIKSFSDERFEDTLELIPLGYESLTSIQSSQTALNVFYSATSSQIKKFFYNNWRYLLVGFAFIILFWALFRIPVRKAIINHQIHSLEIRRDTIKKLMENLQKQYFSSKKISEQEYTVKMKSFNEMLLNLTRQILVLKEELSKYNLREKK